MFSAFKKFTKSCEDRGPTPVPMSSSLQKRFSKGVHYNMKVLIKGDRNVGKSCLLQRLQGGAFCEDYIPTEQIQVAAINWTYKNSDHIVKVEVWEVVDKSRVKKKSQLGLKLDNAPTNSPVESHETPALDASFLDVYKHASGVILMFDITKPWTFDYVKNELEHIPGDLPVMVLGNHCDMQHHRQVHAHHIQHALHEAKLTRSSSLRYAEASMRNGFGLRYLHKFLSVPFLTLQRNSLLEQLQRNQKDTDLIQKELDAFQNSEECQYELYVERLASKRREKSEVPAATAARVPSIVLGAGKPIVPPDINPILAKSLNTSGIKTQQQTNQLTTHSQYSSPDVIKPKYPVSLDMTPSRKLQDDSEHYTPSSDKPAEVVGELDDFYAGALDSSFLDDVTPISNTNNEVEQESDNSDGETPKILVDQGNIDIDCSDEKSYISERFIDRLHSASICDDETNLDFDKSKVIHQSLKNVDYPLWARDSSVRRSPEGGEDPDVSTNESIKKVEKKHKKKRKEKEEQNKSERKNKQKHKMEKTSNPQQDLLAPNFPSHFKLGDYDVL